MVSKQDVYSDQIQLIKEAMNEAGVWSTEVPDWIHDYHEGSFINIWQWLQFIHLPMRLHDSDFRPRYLAPQVSLYISDPCHRHILQRVIELDSITSTLHK